RKLRESLSRMNLADSAPGAALMGEAFKNLSDAIRKEQERLKKGGRALYWQELVSVRADKLALITLKTVLFGVAERTDSGTKATMVARRIGEWVVAERLYGEADKGKRRFMKAIL